MNLRRLLLCGTAGWALGNPVRADDAHTNAAPDNSPTATAADFVEKGTNEEAEGKFNQAANEATRALTLDPKNTAALDLRGSVYVDQQFWDLAERDFTTLTQLSADPAYHYKLAQIKYLQHEYDDARPLFAALKDDGRLGDLARYKVFVCDLLGGHESIAARDLSTLDTTGQYPSYYYGRAIWNASHGNPTEANHLAAEASGKFSTTLCALYVEAYTNAHLFHPLVATFTTKDGRKFDGARVFLENDGLRTSTQEGWVTIPVAQLPEDLSPFPADLRDQIAQQRNAPKAPEATSTPVSFTTKSGKDYSEVRWAVTDTGLLILTTNGWLTVPFSDLPDDLSAFPNVARDQIAKKRRDAATSLTLTSTVTFTTKHGKHFEGVRGWLNDDGIAVTTPDGPLDIPTAELPDDLSAFPVSWQKPLAVQRNAQAWNTGVDTTVTFTTTKGVSYHNVRASLGSEGLMVLTVNGWVTVPLAELPADLAAFPAAWRSLIAGWLKSSTTSSPEQVVSFDTKRGKHYDQVRASLDDKGLDVLSPDGWVVVGYDQLPDDLSSFPAAWRATISERQREAISGMGARP